MTVERSPAKLPQRHRNWIVVNALGLTALINLVINGGIAWLSTIGIRRVPLLAVPVLGGPSTITDTMGTLLLLPLITSVLVGAAVRRDVHAGHLPPLPEAALPGPLPRLPRSPLARGRIMGIGCMALLGPPGAILLVGLGFGDISPLAFIFYKSSLGLALGAIVTPLIALHAMTDPRRDTDLKSQTLAGAIGPQHRSARGSVSL